MDTETHMNIQPYDGEDWSDVFPKTRMSVTVRNWRKSGRIHAQREHGHPKTLILDF